MIKKEGVVIRTTLPATGSGFIGFHIKWFEVDAF